MLKKFNKIRFLRYTMEVEETITCDCDCGCQKENDREENDQCDDCDNGIHWDDNKKRYVNYDEDE